MTLYSLDPEQSLYVIEAGKTGYSCYGYDVLDRKARAVAAWCKVLPPSDAPGTFEHFEQCNAIMSSGEAYARKTGQRCAAELVLEFIGREGRRVEVVDCHGEQRRFLIGKSTGWMPCHLELATHRSTDGPAVTGTPFRSVRFLVGRRA